MWPLSSTALVDFYAASLTIYKMDQDRHLNRSQFLRHYTIANSLLKVHKKRSIKGTFQVMVHFDVFPEQQKNREFDNLPK